MTKSQSSSHLLLVTYVTSRIASTTFDSAWLIALPLFFADVLRDSVGFGNAMTLAGVGEILGLFLVPVINSRFRSQTAALFCDLLAVFVFGITACLLSFGNFNSVSAAIVSFITAFAASVWFANSDAFMSTLRANCSDETLQRSLVLSNNTGSVLGPALGGITYSVVGLTGIATINSLSFLVQYFALRKASQATSEWQPSRAPVIRSLKENMAALNSSVAFRWIVMSSVCVKICMMAIGFLIFRARELHFSSLSIGVATSALGIGVLAGTLIKVGERKDRLLIRYSVGVIGIPVFLGIACVGLLEFSSITFAACGLFGMGAVYSNYLVSFRLLRQRYEQHSTMPSLIAAGGLIARLGLPIGGLVLPYAFDGHASGLFAFILWLAALAWMAVSAIGLSNKIRNFEVTL